MMRSTTIKLISLKALFGNRDLMGGPFKNGGENAQIDCYR
jgi:hypothetical protein